MKTIFSFVSFFFGSFTKLNKPKLENGEREKSGKAEKQKHKMLKGIYFISTFSMLFFLCCTVAICSHLNLIRLIMLA